MAGWYELLLKRWDLKRLLKVFNVPNSRMVSGISFHTVGAACRKARMALNSLLCADVPLRNCSINQSESPPAEIGSEGRNVQQLLAGRVYAT